MKQNENSMTMTLNFHVVLCMYIVNVTLTSAGCDTVTHMPMMTMIFRQLQRTFGFGFYKLCGEGQLRQ